MTFEAEFEIGVGELGLKPHEFWDLTIAEFNAMVEGFVRCRQYRSNELISLAWHTEAFARTKKLPDLKSLMQTSEKKKKEQSSEEMMAMCKLLNAAFGGVEI